MNLVEDDSQSEGSDAMWYVSQVNCLENEAAEKEGSLEYDPGQTLKCQLDTGSMVNVMGFTDLQRILQDGNQALLPSKAMLKLYDGTLIRPRGEYELKTDQTHILKFPIMETSQIPTLLSADTCQRLDLLHIDPKHVIHSVNTQNHTHSSSSRTC